MEQRGRAANRRKRIHLTQTEVDRLWEELSEIREHAARRSIDGLHVMERFSELMSERVREWSEEGKS